MTTPADPVALLPCPMCGHHASVFWHWTGGELDDNHCYVECENGDCSLSLDQDEPKEKAIKRWNTRAALVAITAQGGATPDFSSTQDKRRIGNLLDHIQRLESCLSWYCDMLHDPANHSREQALQIATESQELMKEAP